MTSNYCCSIYSQRKTMREKIIIAYRDVINFLNNKKKKLYYVCSFTFANKIQVSIVILNFILNKLH